MNKIAAIQNNKNIYFPCSYGYKNTYPVRISMHSRATKYYEACVPTMPTYPSDFPKGHPSRDPVPFNYKSPDGSVTNF